jgi:hypothetical protein
MQALVPAFLRQCKGTTFPRRALTIAHDGVRWRDILRFTQLFHDSSYLSGRKRLTGGLVARLLQLPLEL